MHTYIHTYTHTYMHAYMHAYIHTHIHTRIHTYIHTYTHTYIHTYNIPNDFDDFVEVRKVFLLEFAPDENVVNSYLSEGKIMVHKHDFNIIIAK
jgi:hypothetical protein